MRHIAFLFLCTISATACSHDAATTAASAHNADATSIDSGAKTSADSTGTPATDSASTATAAPDVIGTPVLPTLTRAPLLTPKPADMGLNPALGIVTSRTMVLLALHPTCTTADWQQALTTSGATVAAALPEAAIVQLQLPAATDFATATAKIDALRALPGIAAVTEDALLTGTIVPPANATPPGAPKSWDWTWATPSDANWGLENIGAPWAWNLNAAIDRAGLPTPVVGVIDSSFPAHPDLPAATGPVVGSHHGTAVAGIIAAKWGNGTHTDGIVPDVTLNLQQIEVVGDTPEDTAVSFTSVLNAAAVALSDATPRPRVVNISQGYNWARVCHEPPGAPAYRCDPQPASPITDQGCSATQLVRVRKLIAAQGQIFANAVSAINKKGPMLFVVAAGNDSAAPTVFAAGKSYCALDKAGKAFKEGLGPNFPQDYASPMVWAASHDLAAAGHLIVVEALAPPPAFDFTGATRANFSNAKTVAAFAHTVFAPGQDVGILLADAATPDSVDVASGTSFAAPMVTGAAAFLLGIEPNLDDATLIMLLTQPPFARAQAGGGSLTDASLDLFGAAVGIDKVWAPHKPPVRQWLADMDDGSADGFERTDIDTGAPTVTDNAGDDKVDLRDFRRLRDNFLIYDSKLKSISVADGNSSKWDLNEDGVTAGFGDEPYPRALLCENTESLAVNETAYAYAGETLTSLQVLQAVYAPPAVQPWPAEALPMLLTASAELVIRATKALALKKAASLELQITDTDGKVPTDWAPYLGALQGLTVEKDDLVLTVPIWPKGLRVRWRASPTDDWTDQDIAGTPVAPPLKPGEDRLVELSQCQPPIADLKPSNGSSNSICLANPADCNACYACGICPNPKAPLDASASHNPDGTKTGLTYAWQVTPSGNVSCLIDKPQVATPDPINSVHCIFGKTPACSSMLSESATVVVTVSNSCGKSTATRKIPMNCLAKFSGQCF